MRKKNKLYTVNKFNKPLFVPKENTFDWGGLAANAYSNKAMNSLTPWSKLSSEQQANEIENYKNSTNAFGISKADNPFSKGNLQGGLKSVVGTPIGGALVSGAAGAIGGLAGNAISGGLESGAGNAISSIGSTVGSAVGSVNPVLGAAVNVGSQILGGVTNALFGTKVDQAKLNNINQNVAKLSSFESNAGTFDDIRGPEAVSTDTNAYSGGLLSSGKAKRKNRELKEKLAAARDWANKSVDNNVFNLVDDQMNNALANYSAFGGPLDMGAINYDFMTDYLIAKNKKTDNKSQMTNLFAGSPSTMFAIGGDLQTNGSDFSTNLIHIDAGGSHSENPNDGVQMGVDSQNIPNLVEEGETVYDDYVFSNRIMADSTTKELFKLPKKKDITFAEISKKLEKEISERPADPISEAGFKSMMLKLEEQQERQKQEMEAERARAAFEALSPEEQTAVMKQAAEQEAIAQQAAEEEAIAEQQAMQQLSPEEAQMMQQQQMMQQEPQMSQPQVIQACGGKMNKYDNGGRLKQEIYKLLGVDTDPKFEKWAKSRGNREFMDRMLKLDWNKALEDSDLMQAIAEKNPALADALGRGYDFGDYKATGANGKNYDWNKFWEPTNEYSKQKGTHSTKYKIDKTYKGDVKELEDTDKYKAFTDYILNNASDEERMNYFKWIDDNTGRANKYIENGKLRTDWKKSYEGARNDGKYGIQHYTPEMVEKQRGAQAQNMLWNEETQGWDPITGEVNPEYESQGSFSWQTPDMDNTINYYKAPAAASAPAVKTPEEKVVEEKEKNYVPKLRDERLRYAGLFGPAVGLGLMAAGVGKPDTASLEAAARGAGNVHLADYQPIGDYLTYKPMDIWYQQNALNAQARATDRALLNSSSPSKAAGLLASGYNSQLASGNLYRQALEYNDALREKVAGFNRGTNQFNAEAYNRNSQFNADAKNRATQAASSLALQAAREKLDADAGWYNSLYGNIGGLFEGLANIGTENARHNMLAKMAADGVFGNTGKSYTGSTYTKEASEGDKVKKKKNKRGLTF